MNLENFMWWLEGYCELSPDRRLCNQRLQLIKDYLVAALFAQSDNTLPYSTSLFVDTLIEEIDNNQGDLPLSKPMLQSILKR